MDLLSGAETSVQNTTNNKRDIAKRRRRRLPKEFSADPRVHPAFRTPRNAADKARANLSISEHVQKGITGRKAVLRRRMPAADPGQKPHVTQLIIHLKRP